MGRKHGETQTQACIGSAGSEATTGLGEGAQETQANDEETPFGETGPVDGYQPNGLVSVLWNMVINIGYEGPEQVYRLYLAPRVSQILSHLNQDGHELE